MADDGSENDQGRIQWVQNRSPVVEFNRAPSDDEKAARHKAAIDEAVKPFVEAVRAAKADGFYVEAQAGYDQWGRYFCPPVTLVKRW